MSLLLRERFFSTKFLTFDFETEGLNQYLKRPWQLFFQVNQGDKVLEQHNLYVKWPDLKVSDEAVAVTGFDSKIIELYGREPKEVLEFFEPYLYNNEYLVIGHNLINYDAMIHTSWRRYLGKSPDWSWMRRLYDTNCLARMWKKQLRFEPNDDWLLFQYKLNNYVEKGLKTSAGLLAREFDIPHDPKTLHKAENDVPVTFQIFKNLIFKTEI